ncbi:MAG: hypothetical protein A2Y15_07855 [Clostridiales bacterium GWF2_36_10]|nr:MAG: hypothetical protein A2Y15_07855 [Clostridiales bacterium GWF2_36_10]
MKAVIVDIKNKKFAAALSDDGCINKVLNKNYAIGQVIELKSMNFNRNKFAKIATVAAAFLIICGAGAFTYFYPSTYVSLDVNPSIEYSLNMFDRVISVKGINDDGTEIVSELSLENLSNKSIDEAIKLTVAEIAKQGYFEGDIESEIVITTSAKDLKRASELAEELKEASEETIEKNDYNTKVEAQGVGKERVKEAKALGITPGKLNLIEKLKESSSDPDSINVDEWKDKSVKEIKKATKANRITTSLTEEQLALITPALDVFKTEITAARETFNTAFEAIIANYTQKIEAAKTEYQNTDDLAAKLDELKASMLDERRILLETLKAAINTSRAAFLQTVSEFEIAEEILNDYIKYSVDQEIDINAGYKEFLKDFACEKDSNESKEGKGKKEESKQNDKDNKSKNNESKDRGNNGKDIKDDDELSEDVESEDNDNDESEIKDDESEIEDDDESEDDDDEDESENSNNDKGKDNDNENGKKDIRKGR